MYKGCGGWGWWLDDVGSLVILLIMIVDFSVKYGCGCLWEYSMCNGCV